MSHPFWSVTRQDFVDAGDLEIGEAVVALDGQHFRLTSITPRAGPEPVFNLEFANQHTYFVSDEGLLVHNAGKGLYLTGRPSKLKSTPLAKPGDDLYVGTYGQIKRANKTLGKSKDHTEYHVLQNAVNNKTGRVSMDRGIAINMKKTLHKDTRTHNNPKVMNATLRQHLAADIRDLRKNLTNAGYNRSTINRQLKELVEQNKKIGL